MNTASISILIAARNEEENIERCLACVVSAMPEAEVLVIDGGRDKTGQIVGEFALNHPRVRLIQNENDCGKGHAIKRGIQEARGDCMAQFDCDLQFYAEDLPAMLEPLRRGEADLVIGSRFLPSANREAYHSIFFRDAGNRLLAFVVSVLAGQKVSDVTTGMKAWSREAISAIDFRDNRYSYEAEVVVRAASKKLRILEIPVQYASRTRGESMHRSTWAVVKAGFVIIMKSIAARFRA